MKEGQKLYLQPMFFLIRRLMLCIAVTVTRETLIAQIIFFTVQSFIAFVILVEVKPFTPGQIRIEMFNEVILLLLMYTIMCLS